MASSSSLTFFTCLSSLKMTVKPMAALSSSPKTKIPYELKKGQNRLFHKLPSGLKIEVIEQRKCEAGRENPPLVFVHGSYHAAWCWAEHWLPFFSSSGFDSYAVSLLGQGESDEALGTVAGTLQIAGTENAFPELSGAVLVCSVPPSGNSGLVLRYLFSKPVATFKVTLSLAAKGFQKSVPLCRETFFSSAMDDQLVQCYQDLMKESSRMPLFDLRKLNASLPVPKPLGKSTKLLVLGAKDDFIVDEEGLMETGRFYDAEPVCIEGIAHDMMLDCSWKKGAEVLSNWLCNLS